MDFFKDSSRPINALIGQILGKLWLQVVKWLRISDKSLINWREIKLSYPVPFLVGFPVRFLHHLYPSVPFLWCSSLMFSSLYLLRCMARGCRLQGFDCPCYFQTTKWVLSIHYSLACLLLHPSPTQVYCNSTEMWQQSLSFQKEGHMTEFRNSH